MSNENLLQKIRTAFQDVTLGEAYTLPEEDYADTSYWYFDKTRTNLNLTEEEWTKQEINCLEIRGWFPEDRQEAIYGMITKTKMTNRYTNPLEIPSIYLNRYFTGFSYLKPKAYLFYTPSVMIYVLSESDALNSLAFSWWLSRLSWADSPELVVELLKYFDEKQINILIDFLHHILSIKPDNNEIKKSLNNIKLLQIK